MQTCRPTVLAALAASVMLLAACAANAQTATEPADDAALVHRFTLPAKLAWGAVAIDLAPQAWRIGHAGGPVATEAQLRAALADLSSLEVGGLCAGWAEGPTSYPCGFAVRELDLAGTVGERFTGIASDWQTQTEQPQRSPVSDDAALRSSGLIAPVLEAPRFVAVRAPLRYLGDKRASYGGKLQFGIRAVSNALVPSEFDRSSGTVILRSGPRGPQAQPADGRVAVALKYR